ERRGGQSLPFTITCTAQNIKVTHDGVLTILDENDNPPELVHAPQVKEVINRDIDWEEMGDLIDDQIMIVDKDLKSTNNFEVMLYDKESGEEHADITMGSVMEYQITKDTIGRFNIEQKRKHKLELRASCTILTPMLVFDKELEGKVSEFHFNITTTD
ncbi:unnamed protein product, partial [Meganyctiphanes norvegica]